MLKRIDQYRLLLQKEPDMNVEALIYADERIFIEDDSINQLRNATKVKDVQRVLATPDIHSGYGVPIGAVVAMKDKIIPSAVGYDVNCGMRLMTTPLNKGDINVQEIAHSIHRDIPLGEGKANLRLKPEELKIVLEKGVRGIREIAGKGDSRIWKAWNPDEEQNDMLHIEENGSMAGLPDALSRRSIERGKDQLGTLGGGNHFIEIQVVEEIRNSEIAAQFGLRVGQVLVMIHSGSRGLGHQIGNDYMPIAAQDAQGRTPDRTLGFFDVNSKMGRDYIGAMHAAANFAFANRQIMAMLVRKNFRHHYGNIPMPLIYDVPHNMAKRERHFGDDYWIHRKGATRAFSADRMAGTPFEKIGQPVIIPGSMGTASYLLLGSARAPESLFSVNHGAGRVMSRTRAAGKVRRRDGKVYKAGVITDEEFKESMENILLISENPYTIKEEAPAAYKDIDAVIEIVVGAGLAEVVAKMRPLAVLKG